ncbi:MAG TPA: Rrf2 family transcriptional regulator [Candidatus Dormibacteraeota bacterium]
MKTEYGVRAILELAAHAERRSLQSAEIARRQRIPGPFLDQVLMTLRRAGLVNSMRGPHGGHRLARPPDEIRLDEVIACLEGAPRDLRVNEDGDGDGGVLTSVMEKAEKALTDVFAAHTLADCLRLRPVEPTVFHGIYKAAPRKVAVE